MQYHYLPQLDHETMEPVVGACDGELCKHEGVRAGVHPGRPPLERRKRRRVYLPLLRHGIERGCGFKSTNLCAAWGQGVFVPRRGAVRVVLERSCAWLGTCAPIRTLGDVCGTSGAVVC